MKLSWNKQETGRPGDCEKAEGLMYVSMSYKGIRKTPEAQASGVFDCWGIACGNGAARQLHEVDVLHAQGGRRFFHVPSRDSGVN
jgi:hypothetical protein